MTAPHTSPTASLGRLNRILRQLRDHDGRSAAQVAKALRWSTRKVCDFENGNAVKPQAKDINLLLDAYGDLVDSAQRDVILKLVDEARQRGWWWQYRDVLTEEHATYIGLEAAATHLRCFEPLIIPGLLQTAEYARALCVTRSPEIPADIVEQLVAVRMERQQRLLECSDPVALHVVIGEAALRSRVGDAEVMVDQLGHLVKAIDRPNVRLTVVPFAAGTPARGPFIMLTWPESEPETVYVENPACDLWVEDRPSIIGFRHAWERLLNAGLPKIDTLAMIAAIAAEHR